MKHLCVIFTAALGRFSAQSVHGTSTEKKTNSMSWTMEDKCFWYCREGVFFFCNDPITTGSQTMHLAGKYNESFSVLTLKLIEYVLTCLVGVKTVKLNAPGQNLICSIVDCLDHCLHSLVNNRQPARVESLLCLPSFDSRFSILLTSVNRQSVYRKNCSLSQKAVIGSLDMLNIALINERFKPLCTARDYSKAEVQLQPQCLI